MKKIEKVLTVTLNPALDKTIGLSKTVVTAGGKGLNVSRILKKLKVESLACGLCGGSTGTQLMELCKKEGIKVDFLRIKGETRVNETWLGIDKKGTRRVLKTGPDVLKQEMFRFKKKFKQLAEDKDMVILSGRNICSATDDLYAQLIRLAKRQRVPTFLDTSGEPLRLGLTAAPFMVKPNLQEVQDLFKAKLRSRKDLFAAIKKIHRYGVRYVFISLGTCGVMGSDGRSVWHVSPAGVSAVNDVGCGDVFVGGFVSQYIKDKPFLEALKFAVVCATANALTQKPGLINKKNLVELEASLKAQKIKE